MNEEEKIVKKEISENEAEGQKRQKMDPKTKRNTMIIGTIGGLILVGTIATALIGHFANQMRHTANTTPILNWNQQKPGTYDENRVFLTNKDVFSIIKNDDTYAVNGVNLTEDAIYLVMPVSFQEEGGPIHSFNVVPDGSKNIITSLANHLKGVYFPTLYSSLGSYSFSDMPSLEEVAFGSGDGTQKLGEGVLSDNPFLKKVTFSKNLLSIGKEAFKNDLGLNEISLLDTKLNVLGEGAFRNCASLSKVHLPSTINRLPADLFNGCPLLADVYYHSTMAAFQNLPKEESWNANSAISSIICTDGTISL